MKRMTLALSAALLLGTAIKAQAQVSDVSFTVSPLAGYTVWDKNLNLGDAPYYGVRAGFGFGPLFEIRASYERSFDLKGKLESSSWNVLNNLAGNLENSNVDIERFGGELKLNLWSNTILTPYLTAGAGLIKFKYPDATTPTGDKLREEQLYGALGAGLKINLSRRVALALEAKNHIFNVDAGNYYLAPTAGSDKTLLNWGGAASLDIYLGGSRYASDAVTRAYRDMFSDGFRGLKFVIEPSVAYFDFHKDSRFRDTWLLGGSVGVDLSSTVGVRGFYYHSTKDAGKLDFNFGDDIKIYGGNLITRLNVGRGVTPYLTLGGGYMNVNNNYIDTNGQTQTTDSGLFAMGGGGLEIPLHRTVALFGQANVMLTEQENPDIAAVTSPSAVNVNWLFQTGVRFNIGKKSRSGERLYRDYASRQVMNEREARLDEINELRATYDEQINQLNSELVLAARQLDTMRVAQLANERRRVDEERNRLEVERIIVQEVPTPPAVAPIAPALASPATVVMSESQLERIVSRVLSATKGGTQTSELGKLSDLDKILLIGAMRSGQLQPALQSQFSAPVQQVTAPTVTTTTDSRLDALLQKIESLETRLDKKIEDSHTQLMQQQLQSQQQLQYQLQSGMPVTTQQFITTPTQDVRTENSDIYVHQLSDNGRKVETIKYSADEPYLTLRAINPYLGLSFGDATTPIIGARGHFQMGKSRFDLAPELFYAFGNGYGLGANIVYNFKSLEKLALTPYLGAGLGYSRIDSTGRFGFTGLVGVSLDNVLGGRFFVDYSLRPALRNHQIAAGYSIRF